MAAPLLVLGAGAAAAIAASLLSYVRQRNRTSACNSPLPRFFLLETLSDQLHKLPSLTGDVEWSSFCGDFVGILQEIELIEREGTDSVGKETPSLIRYDSRLVKKLIWTIDNKLVPFLQSKPELLSLLIDYLPRPKQSWFDFLSSSLNDEEELKLYGIGDPHLDLLQQGEIVRACFLVVKRLKERVQALKVPSPTDAVAALKLFAYVKPPASTYTPVKVFYATDRKVTEDCEYVGMRTTRGISLHFGLAVVGIPSDHLPGTIEVPKEQEEADPLRHVVILSIDTTIRTNEARFVDMVNEDLSPGEGNAGKRAVLLFIHGFNVSHKDTLKKAAQLKCDLGFSGTVMSYSWPSRGVLYGYNDDAETVTKTVQSLLEFFELITRKLDAERVHILAHSMGNRALIEALKEFAVTHRPEAGIQLKTPISQVILAAADEGNQKFTRMVREIRTSGETQQQQLLPQFTVYCSTEDRALFVSKVLNREGRLGFTNVALEILAKEESAAVDALTEEEVDVVDATGIDSDWPHHGYFGEVPQVMEDIKVLLGQGLKARERAGSQEALIHSVTFNGKAFYAFRPKIWQ